MARSTAGMRAISSSVTSMQVRAGHRGDAADGGEHAAGAGERARAMVDRHDQGDADEEADGAEHGRAPSPSSRRDRACDAGGDARRLARAPARAGSPAAQALRRRAGVSPPALPTLHA